MNIISPFRRWAVLKTTLSLVATMIIVLGMSAETGAVNVASANNGLNVRAVPNAGILGTGDMLEVLFDDPSNTTSGTSDLCLVNNIDVTSSFENVQAGLYRVRYTVSEVDTEREAGAIPIDCTLSEQNTIRVTAFDDNNTVAIVTGSDTHSTSTESGTGTSTENNSNGNADGSSNAGSSSPANPNVGDNVLSVMSIDSLRQTAKAGGNFESGWIWLFRINMPSNENSMQIKFADWTLAGGSTTIPVAENMRISVEAPGGSTTPLLLTVSNEYQSTLSVLEDTDAATPGKQVHVRVEMKIPSAAENGSYSTSYGIRSF